ncbi:MAG: hypothetical protein IPK19_04720 [Chloroflexi bacterium]|nr:hypothetical protein [Chloroflexota bacterium]
MKATQKPGVVFQPQVYQALQRGIRQMVDAVRPTLGPLGRGVAIDHLHNTNPLPEYIDDGGVIARRIIGIRDRDEDVGAMLARSMILRQHERVGDGTATVAVLFEAIFSAGVRYVTAGGNAMQLRRALESLTPILLEALDEMTFRLEGQAALTQMALSLSHDPDIAPLLGEIFDLVGEFGRLEIRDGYGRFLHRDYVEGNTFEVNALSDALLPPGENATLRLENPSFCVTDRHIEDHRDLFPLLKAAYDAQVDGLIIVAQGLSEKAVSLLVTHNNMNKFRVVAVRLLG